MPYPQTRCRSWIIVLLTSAGAVLHAEDKLDLSRVAPVPATEPIPVLDFFRPASLRDPKLNRAGTHLAALISAGQDKNELMVYDLEKATFERLSAAGDRDISSFDWLDDEQLVFSLSHEKRYQEGILATDIKRLAQAHPVLQLDAVELVSVPEKNRLEPLIWRRSDYFHDGRDVGIAKVNTQLNKGDLLGSVARGEDIDKVKFYNQDHILTSYPLPGDDRVVRYLADKDGELAFAVTNKEGFLTLHRFTGDRWEKCPVDLDQIEIIDCGDRPGELVVRGPRGTGKPRPLQFMEAATGHLGEVLLEQKDHDFSGWLYRHPGTHIILGVEYDSNGPKSTWFTEEYRALQKLLEGNVAGKVVRILGSDLAQRRFLIGAFSDRQPITYYWMDVAKRSLALIKNSAPWIDPARMQSTNIMRFKTRDRRPLDAYVTLPAGASKEHPAPMVVLPHDGPFDRDRWGFDGKVQFLASRGYAVLQPNYRGSPGYGWPFAIEEEWDFRKMSDDVADATRAVLTSGLIDRKRVAIMGKSFGAYLALSGVAFEPGLYCCAVVDVGTFDWGHVIKEQRYFQFDNAFYATMLRRLGDPQTQEAKFDALTPLRHLAQVKIPVLVDYTKDDPLLLSESHRLISELENNHVPYEALQVGSEFRGRDYLDNQVELFTRIEQFLAKNLAPASPGVPAP